MRPALRAPLLFAFGCALTACTLSNEGITPPPRQFHYPIAAAISDDSRWLYVVNSDFNLQYNGARVNVVDLDAVRMHIAADERSVIEEQVISSSSDASVRINPFATAAVLRGAPRDASGNVIGLPRLYITVRGDGTLTWMDVDNDHLHCDPDTNGLCSETHRVGHVPAAPRQLTLPPLPVTMYADSQSPFVVVVHQETPRARASLFWDPNDVAGASPVLSHYLGDLSPNLDAVVRIPESDPTADPHYFVFSRAEPTINQVRVRPDGELSYLYRTRLDLVPDLSTDVGIRAVVLDPRPDVHRLYATARPGSADASGATHSPEQLIAFDITDPNNVRVENVMPLPAGPSNLVLVPPPAGTTGPMLAYTVSYDARKLYVIDVDNWRETDEIRTNRGPHWPVFDRNNYVLYLVDFGAMVVEVIDVDPRPEHAATYHHTVFTIGDAVLPSIS